MARDRWRQVEELFETARRRRPEERAAFLRQACSGDETLRAEVESLVASAEEARDFLATPALGDNFRADAATGLTEEAGSSLIGKQVGAYRLSRVIASGGMGTVYAAARSDDQYEKQVAIKLIRRASFDEEMLKRFRRERQTLARLDHANIARLLDGGTTEDGQPFLVMEYIDGLPIDRFCDDGKLITIERLKLFRRVCGAVQYAHQNLIIHRDIKPGNILVTGEGEPKLLDFGIAKILSPEADSQSVGATMTASQILTPAYASPEQIRGEPVTTASDVFSLGIVLYELLTGRRPFQFPSRALRDVEKIVCEQEPARPSTAIRRTETVRCDGGGETELTPESVSSTRDGKPERLRRRLAGDIDNIVLMALRKEPERRYASAQQFSEDIRRHLEGLPVIARKDTFGYRSATFVRRNRTGVIAGGLILVVLVGGIFLTLRENRLHKAAAERAQREAETSRSVEASLRGLFEILDPTRLGQRSDIKARDILDAGAPPVISRLEHEPEAQARVMAVIAKAYEDLGLYRSSAPLREQIVKLRRDVLDSENILIAQSLRDLARARRRLSDFDSAEAFFDEALARVRDEGGAAQALVADLTFDLGTLAKDKGDYSEADRLFREALKAYRAEPRERREKTAACMNALGRVHQLRGNLKEAESLLREALALRRELHGEENSLVASSLSGLGSVLRSAGKDDEAEPLFRQALEIHRKYAGRENLDFALTLNNLALVVKRRGGYDEAEELLREALTVYRMLLGERHLDVATGLNNLGKVLLAQGRHDEAEAMLREGLALRRELLGADHPLVANSLDNVGLALQAEGANAEAEAYFREALALYRKALGDEHPDVAECMQRLGSVLRARGDYAGAEPLFKEALDLVRRRLGDAHPQVARGWNNLGLLLLEKGEFEAAEAPLRQALELYRRLHGDEHPLVANQLNTLANVMLEKRDLAAAEKLSARSLDIYRKLLGREHPNVARTLLTVARVRFIREEHAKAEPLLREARQIYSNKLGEEHWRTANANMALGACLLELERFEEAETLLLKSHARLEQVFGDRHRRTLKSLNSLVRLYEEWAKPDRAAEWGARLPAPETQPAPHAP